LSKAIAPRKPNEWLTCWMALGLLNLGDETRVELVRTALNNAEWPYTRLQAAVALAKHKDYAGIPVLQSLATPQGHQSFLKSVADAAFKGGKPDPAVVRARVADALAAIDHADAVPTLTSLLTDKEDRVRLSAAYGLGRMTDPAALEGLNAALEVDYGSEEGRSRNPYVYAHLVRQAAATFPREPRAVAVLKKGSASQSVAVKFLSLSELKGR
jgi:HEAT repeat protein